MKKKRKKKVPKINIGLIISPSKEDNIKEICKKYGDLVSKEKEGLKSRTIPIFISGSLIDKYISYFEGNNLENLEEIKKINDENLIIDKIHKDINKSILETALRLSKNGEMDNLKILNFVKDNLELKGAIEVLSGLTINKFDSEFFKVWKTINWDKLDKHDYNTFIEIIIELVDNLKDFDLLFKLFNISSDKNKVEINTLCLEKMRDKFLELFNVFDIKKNKNLNLAETIKKSDIIKSIEFLRILQENINEELRNEIYLSLLKESSQEEILNFVVEFYINDEGLSAKALLDIILKCSDDIKKKFLDKTKNYLYINEQNFLEIENKESFIFFKGLLDNRIICNKDFDIFYINTAKETANVLHNKLKSKNEEIKLETIYAFYNEGEDIEEKGKKEKAFKEKLLAICLNDKKESSIIKSEYDKLISTIKEVLDSLKIILDDFVRFFGESQKDNINSIKEYIKNLISGPINYYQNNKNNIDKFMEEYEEKAKERYDKNKSSIFSNIYNDIKIKNKNSTEQSWINKTEEEFKKMKKIFKDNENLDNNTLQICLKTIKGKSKKEILNEFDTLVKLLNINVSEEEKLKIMDKLILLSKKDEIINIADAIILFIINAKISKGDLWGLVQEIQKKRKT